MVRSLLKLALPVTVLGAGGATVFGITSNSLEKTTKSSSEVTSLSGESVASSLSTTPQANSSSLESPTQQDVKVELQALSGPESVEASLQQHKEEQEGNCQVVEGEEDIISELPPESKYVSFFCQNISTGESVLTSWYGFFPETLFKGESQAFPIDKKFRIEVKEELNEDQDDPDEAWYETTFKSEEFSTSSPIVGKWSSKVVGDPSDKYAFKVRLDSKPNLVDYVYLSYT